MGTIYRCIRVPGTHFTPIFEAVGNTDVVGEADVRTYNEARSPKPRDQGPGTRVVTESPSSRRFLRTWGSAHGLVIAAAEQGRTDGCRVGTEARGLDDRKGAVAGGITEFVGEAATYGSEELLGFVRAPDCPAADHHDVGVEGEHEIDEADGNADTELFDDGNSGRIRLTEAPPNTFAVAGDSCGRSHPTEGAA